MTDPTPDPDADPAALARRWLDAVEAMTSRLLADPRGPSAIAELVALWAVPPAFAAAVRHDEPSGPAPGDAPGTPAAGPSPGSGGGTLDGVLDRLAALERRVASLERPGPAA